MPGAESIGHPVKRSKIKQSNNKEWNPVATIDLKTADKKASNKRKRRRRKREKKKRRLGDESIIRSVAAIVGGRRCTARPQARSLAVPAAWSCAPSAVSDLVGRRLFVLTSEQDLSCLVPPPALSTECVSLGRDFHSIPVKPSKTQ